MTKPSSPFELHIDITEKDKTSADWLADNTEFSKSYLKQVMNKGAVWLTRGKSTQRLRRADKKLQTNDILHLYFDEKVLSEVPAEAILISDEDAYSIWYKPFGMLSQGSKWGDHCSVARWAEKHLEPERPAFIVHRLDKAATGLIIIAHQKKVAAALSDMFKARKVDKHYHAVVHGKFPKHEIRIEKEIDDKPAISIVNRLDFSAEKNCSLLDINIETGRKHQIRIHLSNAGYPIVGDRLYGVKEDSKDLQLAAISLEFECPVTQEHRQFLLPGNLLPCL